MDANSKLGKEYIAEDPHGTSSNGFILGDIIRSHNLILGNGNNKCTGTITRKRVTKDRCEQSVIDLVMLSPDLIKHLVSVHIDEEQKHVLTKIHKTKKGVTIKKSDHNTIIRDFNIKLIPKALEDKDELYNLKNKEG